MKGKRIRQLLWIVISTGLIGSGCVGESKSSIKQPGKRPGRTVQAAQWGPDVQGVQCRIRPIKRLWRADESLVFKADFRNQGKRAFALIDDGSVHAERILLDDRWYSRPLLGSTGGRPRLLGPGDQLDDCSLHISAQMALPLEAGPHTIQVAFLLEGLEIVSNPIDFEIAPR